LHSKWKFLVFLFTLREAKELYNSLYRSPELLRDSNSPLRGSQKGDVYSFGIVLYETINRQGPWGDTKLSTEEIVANVRAEPADGCIVRPPLRNLEAPEYVKQCLRSCWDEDPEMRPDIRLIRMKLKPMQAGL
jgi:guanylate cyclase, other